MHGPYRDAASISPAPPEVGERDPEATIIYALLAMLGTGRLVAVGILGEPFGAEATVALVFAILGLLGLAAAMLRR